MFLGKLGSPVPELFQNFVPETKVPLASAQTHVLPIPQGGSAKKAHRLESILAQVEEAVTSVLGEPPGHNDPLMASGLDSLGTVELRNSLETRLGIHLPATLTFDHPTISAIADFIFTITAGTEEPSEPDLAHSPILVQPSSAAAGDGGSWRRLTAIRGASMRLPGADGIRRPAAAAIDAPAPVPVFRWDVEAQMREQGSLPARFGAFLADVELFDPAAFGISDPEASLMDPQQRILLELAAAQVPRAKHLLSSSSSAPCGVFVGLSSTDYARIVARHTGGATAYTATGSAISVAAGRLSFTFGLSGPAVAVDTACSSALVALHTAARNLRDASCISAIAASANLTLLPDTPAAFQKAGMLAPDGRCVRMQVDVYISLEDALTCICLRVFFVYFLVGKLYKLIYNGPEDQESFPLKTPS